MTQGEIATANGNLHSTGAFGASGREDYDRMVDFLKKGHPLLRRNKVLLYAAEGTMNCVREGFRHIVQSHDYPSMETVVSKLRGDTNTPFGKYGRISKPRFIYSRLRCNSCADASG
jgi:hypothetical protein